MTTKITPEAVKERIAALESAGELSLKEQFYLEALRQLVASVGSYPVALQPELANYPPAPVVSADLLHTAASAIEDLLTTKDRTGAYVWFDLPFRLRSAANAQPAKTVQPVMFIDGDISTEDADKLAKVIREFNEEDERPLAKMARIIRENPHPTNECDMPKAQPAPVVPELRVDWQENEFSAGWNACRAAMLQENPVCTCPSGDGSLRWPCPVHPGNSPVIPDGWTGNDKANAALMMLDRIETVDPVDDDRIDGIKRIVRELASATQPQNAPQNIPEIIPDSCTWTFSNYDDHWTGTCGVEWIFPDGGPEENGVKFCPKCGKSVAVSATEGTEE